MKKPKPIKIPKPKGDAPARRFDPFKNPFRVVTPIKGFPK